MKDAEYDWGAKIETDDQNWVMVSYEDVKWYDGYNHPAAVRAVINRFTDTFDANDTANVAWEMIRIGEDLGDIEHSYSEYCDWRLNVGRAIHFN